MARDFRHGPARRETYQRSSQLQTATNGGSIQIPGWFWVLVAIFGLVFGYSALKHFSSTDRSVVRQSPTIYQNASTENGANQLQTEQQASSSTQPGLVIDETEDTEADLRLIPDRVDSYSFYVDLAQAEVLVDVEPLPVELPEPVWIQAGSFKEREQALREQTRLANVGLTVDVRLSETAKGTYYRIISGPYMNKIELNQVRNRFRRMGADTQVMRQ